MNEQNKLVMSLLALEVKKKMKNLTILLFLILLVGCKSESTEVPVEEVLPAEVQETLIEEVKAGNML